MSTTEEVYVNKRDQAPSYCDRCLFKNNTPQTWSADFYRCVHAMNGSDHRPVQLGLTLKDFGHPTFQELARLLDREHPRQGYGEVRPQMVNLSGLNFSQHLFLKKFAVPAITESPEVQKLHFRVAFYDLGLDKMTAPVVFSEPVEIHMGAGGSPQAKLDDVSLSWTSEQLPNLRSALNTLALVKQSRLLMTVWAAGHPWCLTETLIG